MSKTYTYVALDKAGQRQTGVIDAMSERQALDRLAGSGLLVETITEGKVAADDRSPFVKHVGAPLVGKVNYETLQRFFAQLGSMYKSGVPLLQALDTLANNARHPKLRYVLFDMREYVLQGKNISECMEKYPEVFGSLLTNLVRVGEQGGVMDRSLKLCADYLEREVRLRNKMKKATFWGKVMLFMIVVIPLGANIVTQVIARQTGGPSIQLVSFGSESWFWVMFITAIIAGVVLFRILLQIPEIKAAWDSITLRVPYIGPTIRMLSMAKFSRAFAALYSGGVPVATAVALSADACGNEHLRRLIRPAASKIQEGKGITESFAETRAFTRIALDMSFTGEKSGNMEPMFEHVAEQYEDEADVRFSKLADVIPVVLTIIAGIVVLYIVASFYTSYFSTMLSGAGE